MRIYISGPITGVENYLEHFKAAEDYWTSQGFSCINPAAISIALETRKNMKLKKE